MSTPREYLDSKQYTKTNILRYEKVNGKGVMSSGGLENAKTMIELLNLKSGRKVLDVGCGVGGLTFHMASEYGVSVLGVDISKNMLEMATERLKEQSSEVQSLVELKLCNVVVDPLPKDEFDFLHCRDVLLHISDKKLFAKKMFESLKAGGRLAISDYLCGEGDLSTDFLNYMEARKYHLITLKDFEKLFKEAGFVVEKSQDVTVKYRALLEKEVKGLKENEKEFLQEFTDEEYQEIKAGWEGKLRRCQAEDHRCGFLIAVKPQ